LNPNRYQYSRFPGLVARQTRSADTYGPRCRSAARNRGAAEILIADALNMYYRHKVLGHGGHTRPEETKGDAARGSVAAPNRSVALSVTEDGDTLVATVDGQTAKLERDVR
jgi:hypothetical protein